MGEEPRGMMDICSSASKEEDLKRMEEDEEEKLLPLIVRSDSLPETLPCM